MSIANHLDTEDHCAIKFEDSVTFIAALAQPAEPSEPRVTEGNATRSMWLMEDVLIRIKRAESILHQNWPNSLNACGDCSGITRFMQITNVCKLQQGAPRDTF